MVMTVFRVTHEILIFIYRLRQNFRKLYLTQPWEVKHWPDRWESLKKRNFQISRFVATITQHICLYFLMFGQFKSAKFTLS